MQPDDPSLHALAERVAKLEAQNRRLKQAGIAALVLASASILMGQTPRSRVLEANEFRLKDGDGSVRARLSTDAAKRPVLSLLDAKGVPVASFGGGRANPPSSWSEQKPTNKFDSGRTRISLDWASTKKRSGQALRSKTVPLD